MSITFNNVSDSVRASKTFIELAGVKRSLASLFIKPCGVIIGMYDPAKTSTVDYVPVKVLSSDDVGNLAGFGSHAHRQALRFPASTFLQGNGVYWIPVPEAPAGTAASETVTFTGTASSAGTLFFSIGGESFQVAVPNTTVADAVSSGFNDKVTALRDVAVTASASAAITTLTSKFKGLQGNELLVIQNPGGESQENQNPAGITVVLGESDGYLANGATDPDIEDVFFDSGGNDILGDRWYTAMTMPFTDATNIGYHVLSAEKRSDPAVNRMYASYGGYVKNTYAQALAIPATINSEWVGTIWENRYEAPAFELAAELVGTILDEQNAAPNRPYKNIAIVGQYDADTVNRRYDENDALFRDGMGYCNINLAGNLLFGDIALTRRTNDLGGDTEEWYDAVSLHSRQAKAYSIEQIFLSDKYQRGVVVDNDAPPTNVSFAIAPKDVVSELTKLIEDLWIAYSWSKNADDILASIVAEINGINQGRIDTELIDDEARALRIIAVRYAYLY